MRQREIKSIDYSKSQRCINLTNKVWQLGYKRSTEKNLSFSQYVEQLITKDVNGSAEIKKVIPTEA